MLISFPMDDLLQHLGRINPQMDEHPSEFNVQQARTQAQQLHTALEQALGQSLSLDLDIQDATYHAAIGLPRTLTLGQLQPAIRLSNFQRLAVITGEEGVPPDTRTLIMHLLAVHGYQYVLFAIFGRSFQERQRFNGDVFNSLFDYV
jgi:hypothetical protein